MRKIFALGTVIPAILFFLLSSGRLQAQTNIDVTVTPGGSGVTQSFTMPAAAPGSSSFISILPIQSPGIVPAGLTTYRLKRLVDAAFSAVPPTGTAPVGSPVHSQIMFTAPIAGSGLALIQIDHLTNQPSATWQIQIQTGGTPDTICHAGILAHTTQALTQVPRFAFDLGAAYYNNHCTIGGALPVPGSLPMNYLRTTVGASRTLTVTVHNSGTASLPLSLSALAAPFSVGAAGAPLAPNERRDVLVTYTPIAAGTQAATLTASAPGAEPNHVDLALTGQALFRDLILCVDRSNSMNYDKTGSTALAHCTPSTTDVFTFDATYDQSRIRQVRSALELFRTNVLSFNATDPANVVRVGMVHFPAESMPCGNSYMDSQTYNPPGRSGRVPSGAVNLTVVNAAGDLDPNITAITDHGFYHSTPMIAGLETSRDWLFPPGSSASDRFRAIILFSDGAHNVPDTQNPDTVVTPTLVADSIRLYAVAFGTTASVNPALLQTMATQTRLAEEEDASYEGFYHYDPATMGNDANLDAMYTKIFKDLMELDTAVDPPATIAPGTVNRHEVLVTEFDQRINFTVAWKTPQADLLRVELVGPDGRRITPTTRDVLYFEGRTHKAYAMDLGKTMGRRQRPLVGKWTIEVSFPRPAEGAAAPPAENYNYSAMVNSDLRMKVRTDRTQYYTGDKITLTVKLSEEGRPMRGRDVRVQLARPDMGLGNWFAEHKVSAEKIAAAFAAAGPNAESLPGAYKKQLYLTAIEKLKLPQEAKQYPDDGIPMHDDGTHGDAAAGDGIYSITLDGVTKTPGTHRLVVHATGKTGGGGPFRRETEIHTHVLPKIETALLSAQLKLTLVGGDDSKSRLRTFRARVEPKDRFGNFMGPGYERDVNISSSSGRSLTSDVVDDLEGGYYRDFEFDAAASAPVVEVSVRGEKAPAVLFPVEGGTTSTGGGGGSSALSIALLLALIIILFLLALLSRCCGRKI